MSRENRALSDGQRPVFFAAGSHGLQKKTPPIPGGVLEDSTGLEQNNQRLENYSEYFTS